MPWEGPQFCNKFCTRQDFQPGANVTSGWAKYEGLALNSALILHPTELMTFSSVVFPSDGLNLKL
jgi:hypothetical protein